METGSAERLWGSSRRATADWRADVGGAGAAAGAEREISGRGGSPARAPKMLGHRPTYHGNERVRPGPFDGPLPGQKMSSDPACSEHFQLRFQNAGPCVFWARV
jgi:hypothetical protein